MVCVPERVRTLALCLLCALATSAAAAPLDDARRHYQRLEYDQALALLDEARRTTTDDHLRAEAWLLEGYIEIALARDADARRAFSRALSLDESLRPQTDTSPRLLAAFNQALASRRARQDTVVHVDDIAAPPVAERGFDVVAHLAPEGAGARLHVTDGGDLSANLPMTLGPRGHVAHVPAEFARPAATLQLRVEVVDDGEVVKVGRAPPVQSVRLPAYSAAIEVRSRLTGADVTVQDRLVGRVPLSHTIPVEPGPVRVRVRRGADVAEESLIVHAGEVATVALSVRNDSARVRLTAARYTLLGLGGALAITGGVLLGQASASARDLEGAVRGEPGSGLPTTEFSSVRSFESAGRAYQITGIVTCVVGGVMAVTGAALFGLRPAKPRSSASLPTQGWRF
jgi:hypothetical protein